jgi:RNA recognition motif-containing protein
LREVFKYKNRPAPYLEKHRNVVHTTMPTGRQQEYYEGCTPEEYRVQDEGEYFEPDEEATVCVRNLPYDIDSEDLAQLFVYAGGVVFSEVSLPGSSLSLSGHLCVATLLPQILVISNVCKTKNSHATIVAALRISDFPCCIRC